VTSLRISYGRAYPLSRPAQPKRLYVSTLASWECPDCDLALLVCPACWRDGYMPDRDGACPCHYLTRAKRELEAKP